MRFDLRDVFDVRDSGSKGHGSNGVRDSESRASGVKESGTVRKVVHELKVDSVHELSTIAERFDVEECCCVTVS